VRRGSTGPRLLVVALLAAGLALLTMTPRAPQAPPEVPAPVAAPPAARSHPVRVASHPSEPLRSVPLPAVDEPFEVRRADTGSADHARAADALVPTAALQCLAADKVSESLDRLLALAPGIDDPDDRLAFLSRMVDLVAAESGILSECSWSEDRHAEVGALVCGALAETPEEAEVAALVERGGFSCR
jgi:hypothetical protein